MATSNIKSKHDLNLNKLPENKYDLIQVSELSSDPQVKINKQYSSRRTYDTEYKLRILSAYDTCEDSQARGALLRKEGLYTSRIYAWRRQLNNAKLNNKKNKLTSVRTDNLVRENEQLKKKLAQAEAIIDLQKKVSELLGNHILAPGSSE